MKHQPVLLAEVLAGLAPAPGEVFIDATINNGGHARAIAEKLGQTGQLFGIDADSEALARAKLNLADSPAALTLIPGNFRNLAELIPADYHGKVDGILLDLGFSSEQMDESGRGFSFQRDEPLRMTLSADSDQELTAAAILNSWPEGELTRIFREYGEERFAPAIAKGIVLARHRQHLLSTSELVKVIAAAVPEWYRRQRLHFATKTFQALRIATNDELSALAEVLPQAWSLLRTNGRLAVISFHSLEARIVKNFFRFLADEAAGKLLAKHAIKPTREESKLNPRSRSAQLRIIKKLK